MGHVIGITLPEELDRIVCQKAKEEGMAPSGYIRHLLHLHFGNFDISENQLPEHEQWKRRMLRFAKHVRKVEREREGAQERDE